MPLVTDCSACGQRFAAEAAGAVTCPHCGRGLMILQPAAAKVPASDYWQVGKFLIWAFLAAVLLFAFVTSFLH